MVRAPSLRTAILFLIAAFAGFQRGVLAQQLEPRAYSAAPVGMNFLDVAVGRSSGDIVTDPSLPISDVNATVNSMAVGVGRTFDFFGRTALLVAAFPYARASA